MTDFRPNKTRRRFSLTLLATLILISEIGFSSAVEKAKSDRVSITAQMFDEYSRAPLANAPTPPKVGFGIFAQTMIARMVERRDLESVNKTLEAENFVPWLPGTDFKILSCERVGDYDFVLQSLIKMAYLEIQSNFTLLTEKARQKLFTELLNVSGSEVFKKFRMDCKVLKVRITDTENHILMTQIARYLTNQIYFNHFEKAFGRRPNPREIEEYNNLKNGLKDWMLEHLAEFLEHDFSEFNSRPYESHAAIPIGNLYTYAEDADVKRMAQMVLDYLSAKMAVQSNGYRRWAPFRRQKGYRMVDDVLHGDTNMKRYSVFAGNPRLIRESLIPQEPAQYYHEFMAATETYQMPDMLMDIMLNKKTEYYQSIRHEAVEMFHSSPSFLLTGGGTFVDFPDANTGGNNAWAVPTSVIPTRSSEIQTKNYFRIEGHRRMGLSRRNNLCMTKNFACGFNVEVPKNIPESCIRREHRWTFYDLKNCQPSLGFYLASYVVHKSESLYQFGGQHIEEANYGFFEVVEADRPFDQFVAKVLGQNDGTRLQGEAWVYTTSDDRKIEFKPFYGGLNRTLPYNQINRIVKADGRIETPEIDSRKWPRLSGDVMNFLREGVIEIRNNQLGQKLILDTSNPLKPVRCLLKGFDGYLGANSNCL